MKVMVFVQMDPKDETGAMPSEELLDAMGAYNEELVKAGIMLDVGGLMPTSEGTRVAFHGGTTSVVDGPVTESKEIVVGYWVGEVGSLEEAVEWARRCPSDPNGTTTSWLEVRRCVSLEEFGEASTPEFRSRRSSPGSSRPSGRAALDRGGLADRVSAPRRLAHAPAA